MLRKCLAGSIEHLAERLDALFALNEFGSIRGTLLAHTPTTGQYLIKPGAGQRSLSLALMTVQTKTQPGSDRICAGT